MVAHSYASVPIGYTSEAESGVALWALFGVIETVPSTTEVQARFEETRRLLARRLERSGLDPQRLDDALASAQLPTPRSLPPPLSS